MSKVSYINMAEFGIGNKVNYWNGKKFIKAGVINVNLNPITNIIEYRLFFREGGRKPKRIFIVVTPYKIKESKHFKGEVYDSN